jgi:hypothetical protein
MGCGVSVANSGNSLTKRSYIELHTFGLSLEILVAREERKVPLVLETAVLRLEQRNIPFCSYD